MATQTQKQKSPAAKTALQQESVANKHAVLDEPEFLQLLVRERKRSERSGRLFLLMLLTGDSLFQDNSAGSLRKKFEEVMSRAVRETDFLGWYKEGAVIGAIFTELAEPVADGAEVILARINEAIHRNITEDEAKQIDISVHIFPEPTGEEFCGPSDMTIYPDLKDRIANKNAARAVKRLIDIMGSLVVLILSSPLLAAIAIAIKLTSKGPVLFKQTRIGQYSHAFTFLKFRSMYVDSDPKIHKEYVTRFISGAAKPDHSNGDESGVFKITNDPRVTLIGRFLRKSSLDELPQLINVLVGNMSLVGPRPPLPYEVARYDCWHRRRILEARPGITGLWQVNGRSRTSFDEMVRMDLRYIEHFSLWLDLKILLRTPMAVFTGNGAY